MVINQSKAVIMMTTYNGAKYVEEQLSSLENQTFQNWDLYISDDGSSDQTLQILEKYMAQDDRIKKILHHSHHHGAFNNFYNVMRYVKSLPNENYQYFFYCDQDDIWVNEKMAIEIEYLADEAQPSLCYSDLEFMTADGKDTEKKMSESTNIDVTENPYNLFFSYRYIWGTTMAHNRQLWEQVYIDENTEKYNMSHDNYIGKYAAIIGKIKFIDRPLVLYRRTGNNVSGTPGNYGKLGMLKRLFTKLPQIVNQHAAVYWDDLYFIETLSKQNDFSTELQAALNNGGIKSLQFLKKYRIKTSNSVISNASIKTILLFRLYKYTKTFKRKMSFQN
ncbi:glycosyltransferase family 2 protein [Limosilactobacillus reuteri]|uniref:glycosyltransferase family 2 protein n=1 Tax=Limosilactobacillus reuteri TaxID=1598 RepID=UPI001E308EF1|nr:glycosyltransferase family 2 protein [Limosilactobacillus reuteri]MCC4367629.1 glycosyltransferase family 2 protein [Limosilactobacillus reuteri]